jgi:outer membrane receptor protein involved in Fe transport
MMIRSARVRAAMLAGTALAASAAFAPAQAATAAADETAATASPAETTVSEVTITARKRQERLLDVPVAAVALSNKALDKYATTDINSVALLVPQVQIDHAASGSGAIVTVRGIGSASVDAAIEQEVTINIDGVPISRGRVVEQALFDLSSVDVLKGPQALYFGKNSPAGVISLTSQNPGEVWGGYARAGYEFGAREYFGEVAGGGPLGNGWYARFALRGSRMDGGYVQGVAKPLSGVGNEPVFLANANIPTTGSPFKDYPGDTNLVGRATIVYKPVGSPFDANFKFLGSDYHDRGDSMAGVIHSCAPGHTGVSSLDFGAFLNPGAPLYLTDPYSGCGGRRSNGLSGYPAEVATGYPGSHGGIPYTDVLTYLSSLTMNYRITPELTLTSVTGYYEYGETQFSNYDGTTFAMASGVNNDAQTSISEELRLQSSFRGPANFIFGGFYSHDHRSFHQVGSIGYLGVDPATGNTDLFQSVDYYKTDTYSLFGELNVKLPGNLELAGGARYISETKYGNDGMTYVHPLLNLLTGGTIAAPVGERFITTFTNTKMLPQATLSWHPAPNIMLYGAYKTGFKSGGFSTPAIIPAVATVENQAFNPENAHGGEIGAKFSLFDRLLDGDLTLYHYTYSGLQLTAFDAATTSYFTQNAASATSQGVELNLAYQATRELSLHTNIGYNHARYDSFPDSQCWTGQPSSPSSPLFTQGMILCVGGVQDLTGQPLSRAPDWSVMGGATYDRPLMADWRLGLTLDVRYNSGYQLSTNNSPFLHQNDFALLDISARVYDGAWEFALIGQNLTDTYYAVLGGDKPLGLPGDTTASLGKPRQVTLQITRHF